jgi:hypothetical protein
MGKSNGQCHFCKNEIESLMHLFYRCHKIKHVLDELKHIFNSIFENNIVLVEENLIIGVYEGEITENLLLMNLVICILKWVIWKTGNYIKYNKSNMFNFMTPVKQMHKGLYFIFTKMTLTL